MIQPKSRNVAALLILLWIVLPRDALCQDLEPRRWTPLPIGTNVLGIGIANIEGDILFDPVLLVEDAKFDAKTARCFCVQYEFVKKTNSYRCLMFCIFC